MATTPSVVEKARNTASAGDNRIYSNEGSRKDEHDNGTAIAENSVDTMQSLCNGSRQGKELLYLWRIWAHGPTLQKQGHRSGVIKGRRLEYNRRKERNQEYIDNLKEEKNLESLD